METVLAGPCGRGETGGNGRWAAAALALSMLGASLGTSIANVALPPLARAFDVSFAQVQWVVLSYLIASTARSSSSAGSGTSSAESACWSAAS